MEENLNVVNDTQTENVDSQSADVVEQAETTTSVIEEVAKPQVDTKPVQSPEDNARFAEVRRKAEADARDKLVSEEWGESHGIHTYADFQKAKQAQKEQQRREELVEKGIDPDTLEKTVNEHPAVKKAMEQQKQQDDYNNFFQYFKTENGRDFDVNKDIIPVEVWQEVKDTGKPLADIYAKHEAKVLRAKLAEFEKGSKAVAANAANAQSTPGSVTGNGAITDVALTQEMVDNMSPAELAKRWPEVKKLFKMK